MELFVWLIKEILFLWKKYWRNLKNLNKNCEKLGFFFVFEYVKIKNFKIFKKNNGIFINSLFDMLIYSLFDKMNDIIFF